MSWRLAESLEKLREQTDAEWPNRSRISDGSIGDTAHSNTSSDHNPHCGPGVVTAVDVTHDPDGGPDMNEFTDTLVESRDPRIKYIIWNRRIISGAAGPSPWVWRSYSGSNPHDKHAHISVQCNASKDSESPWSITKKEWDEMATKAEIREVVQEEIAKAMKKLAVGTQKGYDPDRVNIKACIEKKCSCN